MDYWHRITSPIQDLSWNLPEQKNDTLNIVGGNEQSFNTIIRISEYATSNTNFKSINTILPNALQSKLPQLDNLVFLPSTDSGSFSDSSDFQKIQNEANAALFLGDFSKNAITARAVSSACHLSEIPLLITRDTVDLIGSVNPEPLLMNENLVIFASMAQLQKLFRAVYYPKMLLLSAPLMQIVETLHKFTLSYPITIITFHDGQIIVAKNGNIATVSLANTDYSVISLWQGQLAVKIINFINFNSNDFWNAAISALF